MVLLLIRDSQHLALRDMMHDSKGSLWISRIGDGRIVLLQMMRIIEVSLRELQIPTGGDNQDFLFNSWTHHYVDM
ncbi:hypothetical protein C5167_010622 [Papaver somniferum]|uniref:Uncharacterized protein n=1 Tax=Papaver somniferum TaxID=3469 RepID=A0A4Y7K3L7_PAPSO|nr:hypothetical protein C5167_010622 [Papaver somniferum]